MPPPGFIGALLDLDNAELGNGEFDQPIFYDEVTCLGDELALSQCNHSELGVHDCSHYEDAGVVCQSESRSLAAVSFLKKL